MADDVLPLETQLDGVERNFGNWDNYRAAFARSTPEMRQVELMAFDRAFNEERAFPSRTFAEYWQKRRDLAQIDNALRRASR